jgi:Protein of unknown function (DUF3592)
MSKDSPIIYFIPFWGLFFVAIWAVWNIVRDSRKEKEDLGASDWAEVPGRVLSSKVVWGHFEVQYEYLADAQYRQGTHVMNLPPVAPDHYASGAARNATEAAEDKRDFPPGVQVIVKYNPEKPDQSILLCRGKITPDTVEQQPPKFVTLD